MIDPGAFERKNALLKKLIINTGRCLGRIIFTGNKKGG
jgi:hypothetical protein